MYLSFKISPSNLYLSDICYLKSFAYRICLPKCICPSKFVHQKYITIHSSWFNTKDQSLCIHIHSCWNFDDDAIPIPFQFVCLSNFVNAIIHLCFSDLYFSICICLALIDVCILFEMLLFICILYLYFCVLYVFYMCLQIQIELRTDSPNNQAPLIARITFITPPPVFM